MQQRRCALRAALQTVSGGYLQVLPLLPSPRGAVVAPEVALDMHPAPARDTHFDDSSSDQHKSGVPDTESAGGDGSQEATEVISSCHCLLALVVGLWCLSGSFDASCLPACLPAHDINVVAHS